MALNRDSRALRAAGAVAGRYVLLRVVAFVVLFPIYTTVIGAFKPASEVLDNPLVPGPFTLDVLQRGVDRRARLGRYLFNSIVVARDRHDRPTGDVVAAPATPSRCSTFPGATSLFVLFLSTMLVPLEATLVVNRRTVDTLGWLNTYQGLAVPFLATAFGTFLVRQVFLGAARATCATRRRSTAPGISASCATSPSRSCARRSGALALFSFLSTGTSTCGRT